MASRRHLMTGGLPPLVHSARTGAVQSGFEYSCDDEVGRLLATLAATVPVDGRILELGTGTGVGTAWIVHGLGDRSDVTVDTVEVDTRTAATARRQDWPAYVRFVVGDAVELLPGLGQFDLIFADAQGGKWERLDLTVDALRGGGLLVVDDMTPRDGWDAVQATKQSEVRDALLGHSDLVTCELDWATGVILSGRKLPEPGPGATG